MTGRDPGDVFIETSRVKILNFTPVVESSLMSVSLPIKRDILVLLKANLIKEGKQNALEASAELATRCVDILAEKRPKIETVATDSEHLN